MELLWTSSFTRAYKRLARRNAGIHAKISDTLEQLASDPFHPRLRTHKLTGELESVWACSVDYDFRVLFEFVKNPETGADELLLLTMGTHDEVY